MYCVIITILILVGGVNNHPDFHCDTPDEWLNVFKGDPSGRAFSPGQKWPNGIIKYKLHKSLTLADKLEVRKAFQDISSKTCIKFQPRSLGEAAFTEISVDDAVCGKGHFCRVGNQQFAKFGRHCRRMNTMVHELGHNLCLAHEHTRADRDYYLDFRKCSESEIPGKNTKLDTRGSLYDYGSVMHYFCGKCKGGWPKFSDGDTSICKTSKGLSVLDADRLNGFYDCGGCYGHRWIPYESLKEKLKELLPLGQTQDGRLLYACRGHIDGKIAVGKYVQTSNVCYFPYGQEHRLNTGFEVLSVPDELKTYYTVEDYTSVDKLYGKMIRGGRSAKGDVSFIATGLVSIGSAWEKSIGETFESESHMSIAYFPWQGWERKVSNFSVLTCTASF